MKALRILKYIGFGLLGLVFVTLMIVLVMYLWNSLIPSLFHGPVLTFWQTAGLFLLSKILLTGIAPGQQNRHKKEWRSKYHNKFKTCYKPQEATSAPEQI